MNNELYALVNELNHKKDVLDTKTFAIVEGIKEWCVNENNRIKDEFDNLKKFIIENFNLVEGKTYHKSYSDYITYSWKGLNINCYFDNYSNRKISHLDVSLSEDWKYHHNFGYIWTNLPKPMKYSEYQFFENTDMNNKDITYWTDYKRCLVILNEYLTEITNLLKDYLKTLIEEQYDRFNEMSKACKEIDEDNTKTIEIKVKVRV